MSDTTSSPPPSDEGRQGGHGFGFYGLMVVLVLAFYVLSIGPAAKYYANSGIWPPPRFLSSLYAPLATLGNNWGPAERFLSWYLFDVWKANQAKPPPPAGTSGPVVP